MIQRKLDSFFHPTVPRLEERVEDDGNSDGVGVKKIMQHLRMSCSTEERPCITECMAVEIHMTLCICVCFLTLSP